MCSVKLEVSLIHLHPHLFLLIAESQFKWNYLLTYFIFICQFGDIYKKDWSYQRGNQKPYIEEQTTECPKEKVQKDKQRSTKHTHKTIDRITRTPLKIGGEPRCCGGVSSSCSTSGTRRVNLVTNPVISNI